MLKQIEFSMFVHFCVACKAQRHIGITLSGVCPSVCLSGSHTFLIVCLSGSNTFLLITHSYVSQATHAFFGMLPLCSFSPILIGVFFEAISYSDSYWAGAGIYLRAAILAFTQCQDVN